MIATDVGDVREVLHDVEPSWVCAADPGWLSPRRWSSASSRDAAATAGSGAAWLDQARDRRSGSSDSLRPSSRPSSVRSPRAAAALDVRDRRHPDAWVPAIAEVLERMVAAMTHRGPDGEHLWSERDVALGMRRLAIVDVAGRRAAAEQRDGHGSRRLQRRDLQPRAATGRARRPEVIASARVPTAR